MNHLIKDSLQKYLPKHAHDANIIFIVDTSRSIDRLDIQPVRDDIHAIVQELGISVVVLYVDYKYRGCQAFQPGESVELYPIGGGGTNFRPGFEHLEKHYPQPDILFYLTDGRGALYPDDPSYPVVWLQVGSVHFFNPPFGEIVRMSRHAA